MKSIKNKCASRTKLNRKTKYSSSRRNKIKTRVQKGGNLYQDKLKAFLSSRINNSENYKDKIQLNKFDIRIILLYIWATRLYNPEQILIYLKLDDNKIISSINKIINIIKSVSSLTNEISLMKSSGLKSNNFYSSNLQDWILKKHLEELIPNENRHELRYLFEDKNFFNPNNTIKDNSDLKQLQKELIQIFKPSILSKDNNKEYNKVLNSSNNLSSNRLSLKGTKADDVFTSEKKQNILHHLWFKEWPDHGVPDIKSFIKFIKLVYQDIISNRGTTLIHCSAGVGRTGVVYLVLKLMFDHKFELLDNDDVLGEYNGKRITKGEIIDKMNEARSYRMNLVQTAAQFNFIMDIFEIPTFEPRMTNKEFNDISIYGTKGKLDYITDDIFSKAKTCTEKKKNRYGNILPYNNNRVILEKSQVNSTNTNKTCDNYINASYMKENAFGEGCDVITAQCPIQNTIRDFISMINSYNVKRIIMVTNLVEKGVLKCDDYTGDLNSLTHNDISYYNVLDNKLELVIQSGRISPFSSEA
jgi:protein tyrosine phosphatase